MREICYIPTWPWGYGFDTNEEGAVDMTPRYVAQAVASYAFLPDLVTPPREITEPIAQ